MTHTTMQGFTLIELLVVVLIIGILAAVALPQYQIAVTKSKIMRFMPFIKAIAQAQEAYFLANGEYTAYYSKLDISVPDDATTCKGTAGYNCKNFGDWQCIISGDESRCGIHCSMPDIHLSLSYSCGKTPYWACWAGEVNSLSDKVCKNVSQGGPRSVLGSYRLPQY